MGYEKVSVLCMQCCNVARPAPQMSRWVTRSDEQSKMPLTCDCVTDSCALFLGATGREKSTGGLLGVTMCGLISTALVSSWSLSFSVSARYR